MKLNCLEFEQNQQKLYVGTIKAGDLIARSRVDAWKKENPNGYQREVTISRARAFGRYLVKTNGLSPNAILLNVRDTKDVRYKDGILQIPDDAPFWIVDGQHRIKGIEEMMLNGETRLSVTR